MPLDSFQQHDASSVLAQAFCDNPGMVAVFDPLPRKERLARLERTMLGFVRAADAYGEVVSIAEHGTARAVALMFPPHAYPPKLSFELMLAPYVLRAGLGSTLRFLRLDAYMQKHHYRSPHWYLWFLGVRPEFQGQGLGSRLLQGLSERAQLDKAPCYLETDKLSSVRLYERHGYKVQREQENPQGLAFTMWHMLRI